MCDVLSQEHTLGFTYFASSQVYSITPNMGYINQSTRVTVFGAGFLSTSTLTCVFGDVTVQATWHAHDVITCDVPPQEAGEVEIQITPNAFTSSRVTYTYVPRPTINSISPTHVAMSSTRSIITVSGHAFRDTANHDVW